MVGTYRPRQSTDNSLGNGLVFEKSYGAYNSMVCFSSIDDMKRLPGFADIYVY